jgi:hypothetical protein
MVIMNSYEQEEYNGLLELIKIRELELEKLNNSEHGNEIIDIKRVSLVKEFFDLLELKRSLEMEKVPLSTKFTIDELKEFVWDGPITGYTFRGKQVRYVVFSKDGESVDCYTPKYKIVDTPYHIEHLEDEGWSVVERGRFIAHLNDFLYPKETVK